MEIVGFIVWFPVTWQWNKFGVLRLKSFSSSYSFLGLFLLQMSSSKIFFADISSKFLLFFAEFFLLLNNQFWQIPIMENCLSFIFKLKTRNPHPTGVCVPPHWSGLPSQPSRQSRLARYTAVSTAACWGGQQSRKLSETGERFFLVFTYYLLLIIKSKLPSSPWPVSSPHVLTRQSGCPTKTWKSPGRQVATAVKQNPGVRQKYHLMKTLSSCLDSYSEPDRTMTSVETAT